MHYQVKKKEESPIHNVDREYNEKLRPCLALKNKDSVAACVSEWTSLYTLVIVG